jgi:hypothetical protein
MTALEYLIVEALILIINVLKNDSICAPDKVDLGMMRMRLEKERAKRRPI